MVSAYPVADEKLINAEIEQDMQMVMDLIMAIRNIRGEMNIAPSMQIRAIVKVEDAILGEHLGKSAGCKDALWVHRLQSAPAATGAVKARRFMCRSRASSISRRNSTGSGKR
jgi:valyl-tRNA synthetase